MSERPTPEKFNKPHEGLKTPELSREILETVMEKVTDINDKAIAYSVASRLSREALKKTKEILKTGLGKRWHKNIFSLVHFNIVGRAFEIDDDSMQIQNSYWFHPRKDETYAPSQAAIIFDLSSYEEIAPAVGEKPNEMTEYNHKYYCNMHSWLAGALRENGLRSIVPGDPKILNHPAFENLINKGYLDGQGRPMPLTENGFILHGGVSPDLLKGIVVWNRPSGRQLSDALLIEMLLNYRKKNKLNSFLPVYADNGDLLWPRSMNYKQVKEFVAARHKTNSI